jgi:hypothetical protein
MCRSVDHDGGECGTTTGFGQIAVGLTSGFHHGVMYAGRNASHASTSAVGAVKVITYPRVNMFPVVRNVRAAADGGGGSQSRTERNASVRLDGWVNHNERIARRPRNTVVPIAK